MVQENLPKSLGNVRVAHDQSPVCELEGLSWVCLQVLCVQECHGSEATREIERATCQVQVYGCQLCHDLLDGLYQQVALLLRDGLTFF